MIKRIISLFCIVTIISQGDIAKNDYKQEALKSKEKIEVRYANDPGGL
ncbi:MULTISPECIES: hypothetical protein [Bacillus cereus group]|uniref:Uncharacterized protein n=1 Tax=Bacillus cereus TaxID=1396 RepID=A0AAW5L0C5_BACCE|nr:MULTISPECIES: hypothetical protein [Bacillus cereus group]MCQ6286617.1 hypothetical protein [Bacillus cereus]MCQ6315213.1 hypothetical protein [Bacillus cereus]MCQ6326062.1 hypothetical protein [Bacillus cereus]MCQ6383850.1 hypothetical protein [Bacillus cereus]MEB9340157.1 hypothetical protein [Bacillus cereus]